MTENGYCVLGCPFVQHPLNVTGYTRYLVGQLNFCLMYCTDLKIITLGSKGKGKGKIQRRTGHEGPEGEQMCNYTLSLASALDAGAWSTPRPGRFTPGKDPVPIV